MQPEPDASSPQNWNLHFYFTYVLIIKVLTPAPLSGEGQRTIFAGVPNYIWENVNDIITLYRVIRSLLIFYIMEGLKYGRVEGRHPQN